jgi:hypothetical protein
MISPHISSGTVDLTAAWIQPSWTFNTNSSRHLVDLAGQIGALIVVQMLGGDHQLAGDLAAALALGLGDLHGVTGLAASARSRASFSFSMK